MLTKYFFINQDAEMGVMHRIIIILVTKSDGKRGSIVA